MRRPAPRLPARVYNLDPNTNAEFSIDGGANDLARFNQAGNGDYSDWYSPHTPAPTFAPLVTPQVQDAFLTRGASPDMDVELIRLDVLGYTLNTNPPDLTLKIADSVGGTIGLGDSWGWTLHIENDGGLPAYFGTGQRIAVDTLPSTSISYGTPVVTYGNNFKGDVTATITGNVLTITAGDAVEIDAGVNFEVVFEATPSAAGTFANPKVPGLAMVDPDRWIPEINTNNNSAADTVTVTQTRYVTFTTNPNIDDAVAKSFSVSGTGIKSGDTITLSVHDGPEPPYTYASAAPVTVTGGTWTVSGLDVSSLGDGWVFYSVIEKNAGGTTIGSLTAWPAVKGNPLELFNPPDILDSNVKSVSLFGTESILDDPILVAITDGTVTLNQISAARTPSPGTRPRAWESGRPAASTPPAFPTARSTTSFMKNLPVPCT